MKRGLLVACIAAALACACTRAPAPPPPAPEPAPNPTPVPAPAPVQVQAPDPVVADGDVVDAAGDVQLAVGVLRNYYSAINARDFPAAYALWSDGGRSSRQSLAQFAAGFADTTDVAIMIGAAGAIEGAAGSRYVQLPIDLRARQADGSVRRYSGRYSMRRSVVDGATAGQRAWRIASADLHEARP